MHSFISRYSKGWLLVCFLLFGIIIGFVTIWHDQRYDTAFFLNLPGYLLGVAFHGSWTRFISEAKPWIMRVPQVYVLSSLLFWGLIGILLSIFVKPKIVAWIVSIYLVILGGFTIAFYINS